jgi:hypothetical protein
MGLVLVAAITQACAPIAPDPEPEPEPIWGTDPVQVGAVAVAPDGSAVRLEFTGAAEFDPDDPCTAEYEGSARVVDDELRVAVFRQPHPMPLVEGMGCDFIGHGRELALPLDPPFHGNMVRDAAGPVTPLRPPSGFLEIGELPESWAQCDQRVSVEGAFGTTWWTSYSPVDDSMQGCTRHRAELAQVHDRSPIKVNIGDQQSMDVNDRQGVLFVSRETGEMNISWREDTNGVTVFGYLEDFSAQEFVRLAESVRPPD